MIVPTSAHLLVFCAASLALIAVPGPAVLFIVTRSLEQGRTAGLVSALGVQAGGLVHVTAAVLGLSALLASSAAAFAIVKYAGAAYLVALGLRKLLRPADGGFEAAPPHPARQLFRQGMIVNILNPKTALFFLAFLPQFIERGRGPVALQAAVLGLLFVALAMLSDSTWALLAGTAGERLRRSPRIRRRLDRASGTVYVGLGALAATR